MTQLLLVRHAEPRMAGDRPGTEWPLTEKGRNDATALSARFTQGSSDRIVWTSPERRARETASLVFPFTAAEVHNQLSEVKKPWYTSAEEHATAAETYLRGKEVKGWEPRQSVLSRIAELKSDVGLLDSLVVVSHGLLMTTWLDDEIGLSDPFAFWSNLGAPDAWSLDLDEKSCERVV